MNKRQKVMLSLAAVLVLGLVACEPRQNGNGMSELETVAPGLAEPEAEETP